MPKRQLKKQKATLLTHPLDETPGVFETILKHVANINLNRLLSQADVSLSSLQFGITCGVLALVGTAAGLFLRMNFVLVPVLACITGCFPFLWLLLKRRKRF